MLGVDSVLGMGTWVWVSEEVYAEARKRGMFRRLLMGIEKRWHSDYRAFEFHHISDCDLSGHKKFSQFSDKHGYSAVGIYRHIIGTLIKTANWGIQNILKGMYVYFELFRTVQCVGYGIAGSFSRNICWLSVVELSYFPRTGLCRFFYDKGSQEGDLIGTCYLVGVCGKGEVRLALSRARIELTLSIYFPAVLVMQ